MTNKRYNLLMETDAEALTPSEIREGWHFCAEFDGLLVGPGMDELNYCWCWPKGHPVYLTVSPAQDPDSWSFPQSTTPF